jgi:hypothetical protein
MLPRESEKPSRLWAMLTALSTVNLFQKGVLQTKNILLNHPSPQGFSEQQTSRKMGTKQMVCPVRQRTCTSAIGGQTVPCRT